MGETTNRCTGHNCKVKQLKWQWAGHVARINDDRWTRTVTEWLRIHLKRKKARPKMRWEDDIKKYIGVTWMRVARDRKDWKHHEEAFIQNGLITAKKCILL